MLLVEDIRAFFLRFRDSLEGGALESVDIDYRGDRIPWKRIQDPSACHFHRHVAATTILVLRGEPHVAEIDEHGNEIGRKIREAGEYARKAGGEAHMERGGREGAVVFFSLPAQEKDGPIFERLDRKTNVLSAANAAALVEALGVAAGRGGDARR